MIEQNNKKRKLNYLIAWVEAYNKNKKIEEHIIQQQIELKEVCFSALK